MIKSIVSVGTIFIFIAIMLYFSMNPLIAVGFVKSIVSFGFGVIKNAFVYIVGMIK
jgi:hypothetical protein